MGGKSTGKGITFILVDLILDFKGKTYFDICLVPLLSCFVEKCQFLFLLMPEVAYSFRVQFIVVTLFMSFNQIR